MTLRPTELNDGAELLALERIRSRLRDIPDFPKPGVSFKDITPALLHANTFQAITALFAHRYAHTPFTAVAGIDARGFILGAALAHELHTGFIPIRKAGKLPGEVIRQTYDLEYGSATIEVQTGLLEPGTTVLLIDDLIATGGTLLAAHSLLAQLDVSVHEVVALIDLPSLGGSQKLLERGLSVYTLLQDR